MNVKVARGTVVLPQDRDSRVLTDGAIAYSNGRIVAIDSWPKIASEFPASLVLGSGADIIVPGLVNSHHHVGLTPFQLGAPDLPLELWSLARNGLPTVDPYLDTLVSAFEMVESGITTVHHIQGRLGLTSNWDGHIQSVLRAYSDVGMRVTFSIGLRDQSFFVQGSDTEFLASMPSEIAARAEASIRGTYLPPSEHLQKYFVELYESSALNFNDKLRFQLAPLNLHWCSDEALERVRDLSEKYNVGIHMHLLETILQKSYAHRRASMSAVEFLERLGLLSPKLTLGHGVWLTESDIALLKEHDVIVCHNPSSNLRLRSGIAPINSLLASGVDVALGIDEAGINDDRDMFQEMRLALNLHRVPGFSPNVPSALDVWQMATETGARSTGYGDMIGALRVGSMADFSLMNVKTISGVYLDSQIPVIDAIVQRAVPSAVTTVVIGGDTVYDAGNFAGVNRESALGEFAERMSQVDMREIEFRRRLSEDLEPYVRRFYDGWLSLESSTPFYEMNSRS